MHASVYEWTREMVAKHSLGGDVLEVGGMNLNGTVRDHFRKARNYTATDMRPGPGVDRVLPAKDVAKAYAHFPPFDTVVCCEMLEHDERFWETLPALGAVLAEGGHLLLTTRGIGFPLHGYPHDYWRFTLATAPVLMGLAGCVVVEAAEDPDPASPGIVVLGRKQPAALTDKE